MALSPDGAIFNCHCCICILIVLTAYISRTPIYAAQIYSKNNYKKTVEEFFYFKKSYKGNWQEVKKTKETIPVVKFYAKNLDIRKIDSIFAL